jgi:hypothetical protein
MKENKNVITFLGLQAFDVPNDSFSPVPRTRPRQKPPDYRVKNRFRVRVEIRVRFVP